MDVVGRLKPGVTYREARTEANVIVARLEPNPNRAPFVDVQPLGVDISDNTRLALYVLLGAVCFVLLIACANVASLVLARGAARQREIAIRIALGAGRGRLMRQLFTDSVLLALFSGYCGLALGAIAIRGLIALGPPDIPRLAEAGLDPGVLAFTLLASLSAAVLFGAAPALKISRGGSNESLKSGRGRTHDLLVVAEFALAVVLLTGAGLLVRSFLAIQAVDPGFRPERVLTLRIAPPKGMPAVRRRALLDQALERVRA